MHPIPWRNRPIWAARTSCRTLIHDMDVDDKLPDQHFGGEVVAQMACPPEVVNPPK
jgi:hypothetical protein